MVVIATRAPAPATVVVCSTSSNQIVFATLSLTPSGIQTSWTPPGVIFPGGGSKAPQAIKSVS
jgi:hypothetical protein